MESSLWDHGQCLKVVMGIPPEVAPCVHSFNTYIFRICKYNIFIINFNIPLIVGWKIWLILGGPLPKD